MTNIANNFSDEYYEVHFCLFKNKGELVGELDKRINLHILNSSRVMFGVFKLAKLIVRLEPIMVLSSITHINLLLSLMKIIPGLKKYYMGVREVNNPSIRAKYLRKSKMMDLLYSKTINNLDFIIAQSNYMKKDLMRTYRVNPNKIKVINNPIDVEVIDNRLKESLNAKLFDNNKINVLSIGSLKKQKNFSFLIETFQYLSDKFHLYILGDGQEYNLLKDLIEGKNLQDKVTLLGKDKNPYKYIDQADLFCLTSYYEGFPNVIIEANYCGKFALAVRVPGIDEEIITEGINGSLLDEFDKKKYANEIEYSVNVVRDKSRIKSTINKYRIENIIQEYKKLVRSNESTVYHK